MAAVKFVARLAGLGFLLLGAEAAASYWVWGRAPTDTIRVWYPGFWSFEAGRLRHWVVVVGSGTILWSIARHLFRHNVVSKQRGLGEHRSKHSPTPWLLYAGFAIVLEMLTSVVYWRSAAAIGVRDLYQLMWYWDFLKVTPHANAPGWPSLRFYLYGHFFPWAVILLAGITPWLVWTKREKQTRS